MSFELEALDQNQLSSQHPQVAVSWLHTKHVGQQEDAAHEAKDEQAMATSVLLLRPQKPLNPLADLLLPGFRVESQGRWVF